MKLLLSVLTGLSALTLITATSIDHDEITERPVIGIVTRINDDNTEEYIAASYVKWLESLGARSIPVPLLASNETVIDIFNHVNGFLWPGGGDVETHVTDGVFKMWELVLEANQNGDHFPLWGTCLGLEIMCGLVSDVGMDIIKPGFDVENISLPLLLTDKAESSVMFNDPRIKSIVQTEAVTMNNHHLGIPPLSFSNDASLSSTFKILSTSKDRGNAAFVSSVEHYEYPIFGVQWHPEKNNFEFGTVDVDGTDRPYWNINHSSDAIQVSLEMARVFVDEARRNAHSYRNGKDYRSVWEYEMVNGAQFEQRFIIRRLGDDVVEEGNDRLHYLRVRDDEDNM
mmetsp:Transcript_62138/g.73592  ORF Transcript_62138/g.73592 Transcript_62138/m.73592 type:complete len:341 (-) Transcript_62138:131-1153(-)